MPGLAYAIAIGPSLQNPEYTYDDKDHDGKQDESEFDVDKSGNIVEWYTEQFDGEKNRSTGLIQFDRCAGIIIYRDERALVKNEM